MVSFAHVITLTSEEHDASDGRTSEEDGGAEDTEGQHEHETAGCQLQAIVAAYRKIRIGIALRSAKVARNVCIVSL